MSTTERLLSALARDLRAHLAPIPVERRYLIGLDWLEAAVRDAQAATGVELRPLDCLRVLIVAGGDRLDQTVFLPAGGLQSVTLN